MLVPLEAWVYNSPDLLLMNKQIDLGLFSEALLYYDRIIINFGNPQQFAFFIEWFVVNNLYKELLELFDNEVLTIYDYAFMTTVIQNEGRYSLWNIQDPIQELPNTFHRRYLYHEVIEKVLRKSKDRIKLYNTLENRVIEIKASEFGSSIENAKHDYFNTRRSALLLQSIVDEVYPLVGVSKIPTIKTTVTANGDNITTTYNIPFEEISQLIGNNNNFHPGIPLIGAAHCNRLIWSASKLNCDLFLGRPMSGIVGDKLLECGNTLSKSIDIIHQLQDEVEFPDIRVLVNSGVLELKDILYIRSKAKKFRTWLQEEGERDRNAIIAYHNEISKEVGLIKYGRKTLRLFGFFGGPIGGAYVGSTVAGPTGAVVGAAAGAGLEYITDISSKIGEGWRPVVFGNWLKDRIDGNSKE